MIEIVKYANAFRLGKDYYLYGREEENKIPSIVDFSNIELIGYHDGYHYGEYLEGTGQTMSISAEQLIAEIDKHYTQALKKYQNIVDNQETIGKHR